MFKKWIPTLFMCLCLAACGFHFRTKSWLPSQLHTLHIVSFNDQMGSSLRDTFSSMGVRLSKNSPYSLQITDYHLSKSQATSVITGVPSTASYTLSVSIALQHQQQIITSTSFSSSQSITLNSTSLNAPPPSASLVTQFQNDIIEEIYLWLTTTQVKEAITAPKKTTQSMATSSHAN